MALGLLWKNTELRTDEYHSTRFGVPSRVATEPSLLERSALQVVRPPESERHTEASGESHG